MSEALLEALSRQLADEHRDLLVALSGGGDSTALLHVAERWARIHRRRLRAVHVDHGLHPASRAHAEHCRALGRRLGIAVECRPVIVRREGEGLEAAARRARYRALAATCTPGEVILTAHQRDDQVETVLLRLLRGGDLLGLAGIRPSIELYGATVRRPLLSLPRQAILTYLQRFELPSLHDPTNDDLALTRNRIRQRLLPRLRAGVADLDTRLAELAERMARIRARIEQEEAEALAKAGELDPAVLSLAVLRDLHPWLRRRVLHRWCQEGSGRAPSAAWLAALERAVLGVERDGLARHTLGDRHYACFDAGLWRLPPEPRFEQRQWNWPDLDHPLDLGPLGRLEWWGPRPPGDWQVALRRGGERMAVGRVGHRPVKDLLREARLPPWERRYWPLLYRERELWAIPGVLLSGPAARWHTEQGGWARFHVAPAPPLG